MSAREFAEWVEYYKIEPFGDDWEQAGLIAASNIAPWTKRKVKPSDFTPGRKITNPGDVDAQLLAWAKRYNRKIEGQ